MVWVHDGPERNHDTHCYAISATMKSIMTVNGDSSNYRELITVHHKLHKSQATIGTFYRVKGSDLSIYISPLYKPERCSDTNVTMVANQA